MKPEFGMIYKLCLPSNSFLSKCCLVLSAYCVSRLVMPLWLTTSPKRWNWPAPSPQKDKLVSTTIVPKQFRTLESIILKCFQAFKNASITNCQVGWIENLICFHIMTSLQNGIVKPCSNWASYDIVSFFLFLNATTSCTN